MLLVVSGFTLRFAPLGLPSSVPSEVTFEQLMRDTLSSIILLRPLRVLQAPGEGALDKWESF